MIKNGLPYVIEVTYKGRKLLGVVRWYEWTSAHQVLIHGVCNISMRYSEHSGWYINAGIKVIPELVFLLGQQIDAHCENISA